MAQHRGDDETALSLAEQLFLLQRDERNPLYGAPALSAAGALVELALHGRISVKNPLRKPPMARKLVVVDATPTGVPEADRILELMHHSRLRDAYSLVPRMAMPVGAIVGDTLARRGIVRPLEPRPPFLGLFPRVPLYGLVKPEVKRAVQLADSATRVVLHTTTDVRLGAMVDLVRNGGDAVSGEAGSGIQPLLKFGGYAPEVRGTVEAIVQAIKVINGGGG